LAARKHYLAETTILIMIFLLGGAPRVGKSIIAAELRRRYALSVVSTDTLGAVLESVLSPEAAPDLFVFSRFNEMPAAERVQLMVNDPAALVAYVRRESGVIWPAVEAFMRRETEEGRDVLIEGAAVLPELVHQLEELPHRVVFIGNQGSQHQEKMKRYAAQHEHDWLRGASDEYIGAFSIFVKRMSAFVEQEAQRYGFAYIEMEEALLGDVTEKVGQSLGLRAG
jgi:2-phosphoglycerate kinase